MSSGRIALDIGGSEFRLAARVVCRPCCRAATELAGTRAGHGKAGATGIHGRPGTGE